jgi:hypothetical protein
MCDTTLDRLKFEVCFMMTKFDLLQERHNLRPQTSTTSKPEIGATDQSFHNDEFIHLGQLTKR